MVAASGDGILVADKEQSSDIKPYADKLAGQAMYAERYWGSFTVLDVQEDSMTICCPGTDSITTVMSIETK